MTCTNCNHNIPDDSNYCPKCGAPLNKDISVNTVPEKEQPVYNKEAAIIENDFQSGKLMGYASLICAILGLGSFGTLDVVALLLSHFGKKRLKNVPKDYPGRDFAMGLNQAGFLVSGGIIIVLIVAILICLLFFPAVFAGILAL
ncbi:MAG: zinc ribbon domain-containing protein [Clostridia bacterium]|nr:zinc ribbon domain-containing protein [Clostridia bacterium]